MKKLVLISLIASFTLSGCSTFRGISVGKNYIGFENTTYKTLVERVPSEDQKLTHVRAVIDPKQGQYMPQITGDLQDTVSGGKIANIYILGK